MPSTITDRVLGVASQAAIKAPCRVASTGNIATLAGLLTVDGAALADGDRVLVWQQADTTQNGIYAAGTGPWERTTDCNGPRDLVQGTQVLAVQGSTNAGRTFWVTTADPLPGQALVFDALAIPAAPSDNTVTNAKLADMASGRVKGRFSAGTGDPEDGTPDQVLGLIALATEGTAPAVDDTLGLHDASATDGRRMRLDNALKVIGGLPTLPAIDPANDFLLALDATDGLAKKVTPSGLSETTLLADFTVGTAVAEIVFSSIPADYTNLYLTMENVSGTDTVTQFLTMVVSTDNGANYVPNGYIGVNSHITDGISVPTWTRFEIGYDQPNANVTNGTVIMFSYAGPQPHKMIINHLRWFAGMQWVPTSGVINAIKLAWTSGNIDSGTYSLYGVR